jgi:hypothetical protein
MHCFYSGQGCMMARDCVNTAAIICLLLAVVLVLHHWVIHPELKGLNRLFQTKDVANHETWEVALVATGVGLSVAYWWPR